MIRATWIGFQPGEGSINETFNIFDSPLAEERRREGEKKRIVPKHGCKFGSYTNLRSRDSWMVPRRGRGGFLFRTTAALSRAQVTHRYPPRLYDRLLRTGRSYLNLGYTASGRLCVIRVTRSQGRLARRIRLSAIRTGAYKGVLLHAWPLSKLLGDLGDSVVSRVTEKSNATRRNSVPSPIPPTTDAWPIIRRI